MNRTSSKLLLGLLALLLTFGLIFLFLWPSTDNLPQKTSDFKYDSNTIRSTYPVYKDKQKYLRLFQQQDDMNFAPFVGWQRVGSQASNSSPIDIDIVLRKRVSSGHSVSGSWWFFGGSTIFGDGSYNDETIPSVFHQISGKLVLNLGELGWNATQSLMQLNLLLAQGHRPEGIIFYDG